MSTLTNGNRQETNDIKKEIAQTSQEPQLQTEDYSSLITQIEDEYQFALKFIRPKWTKWTTRLKIYNNQKRDDTAIWDPLLFTIHQTILASLYEDKLTATWTWRKMWTEDQADNLNWLVRHDYDVMQKEILDYIWDWDATFFWRGLILFDEFDKDLNTPLPENIDPLTFLRDPYATSVRWDVKGNNKLRFCWRYLRMTKRDLKNNPAYNQKVIEEISDVEDSTLREIEQNKQARLEAQGFDDFTKVNKLSWENQDYPLLEWYTYYKDKLHRITLANWRKLIIRLQEIKWDKMPFIDRAIYPTSHNWDWVSVSDIIEDKQRARAIVLNLALQSVKSWQYPNYLYNQNKIKSKVDLAKSDFNKFIWIDWDPAWAILPIEKQQVKQEVWFMLEFIDASAQKATATPNIQQWNIWNKARTATELSLVSQKVDVRYSLSAKIFGWSEKAFWQQWYFLYKTYLADKIDEKIIKINGALWADKWVTIKREDIIHDVDPNVDIESTVLSEAKRLNDLNAYNSLIQNIWDDQTINRRFLMKKIAKLSWLTIEEIDVLFPATIDELEAENENDKLLNNNKPAKVLVTDDHIQHLEIHTRAIDNSATRSHIESHKMAMMMIRENPQLVPPNLANKLGALTNEEVTMWLSAKEQQNQLVQNNQAPIK